MSSLKLFSFFVIFLYILFYYCILKRATICQIFMITFLIYKRIFKKRRKFHHNRQKVSFIVRIFFVDFLVQASCKHSALSISIWTQKQQSCYCLWFILLESSKWTSDHFYWPVTTRTAVWSLKLAILLHVSTVIYDHQRIIKHQNIFVMHTPTIFLKYYC